MLSHCFVVNLSKGMDNTWLRQLFRGDGLVVDAFVSRKKRRTIDALFCFIRCDRLEAASAIARNGGLKLLVERLRLYGLSFHEGLT